MRLTFLPTRDFSEVLVGRPILATGVGPGNRLAVLTGSVTPAAGDPGTALRGIEKDPELVATAVLVADEGSGPIRELALEPMVVAYPIVQPLADGGLLVASTRASVREGPNAVIFDAGGKLARRALFGDGIEHVLVDDLNRAWVGYFDEGVFGNLGWGGLGGPAPIGASGLVRFDLATGHLNWSFTPPDDLRAIDDCYALNVAEDATWIYYYRCFDLVRIGRDGTTRRWKTETSGARALACDTDRTLLIGRYGERWNATLWRRATDRLEEPHHVAIALPDGSTPTARAFGRGDRILISDGPRWFAANLADLLEDSSDDEAGDDPGSPLDHIRHRHS